MLLILNNLFLDNLLLKTTFFLYLTKKEYIIFYKFFIFSSHILIHFLSQPYFHILFVKQSNMSSTITSNKSNEILKAGLQSYYSYQKQA